MATLRDLSIILLAGEVFLMVLIPLALLGASVYGLWRLRQHQNLPSWLRLTQAYLATGRAYVESAMGAVVKPVFWVHSVLATVQQWLRAISTLGGER